MTPSTQVGGTPPSAAQQGSDAPAREDTDREDGLTDNGDTTRLPPTGALLGRRAPADGRSQTRTAGQAVGLAGAAGLVGGAVRATGEAAPAGADGGPDGPSGGALYGPGARPSDGIRRWLPFPRLRVGSHVANEAALGRLSPAAVGTGVLLGYDRDQKPVTVRMFRPEPTRITLLGGLWAAQLTVFRALAVRARVVVFTNRPGSWQGLGRWATGRDDRVAVLTGERPVAVPSSPLAPTLLLYDDGLVSGAVRPNLTPWQTQLTVLSRLTAYGFPAVQESNLVAMQRLSDDEAYAAASVLSLTQHTTALLPTLHDDMLALLGGGADRYLWLRPTTIEQHRFGAPRR